ncbi:MAG: hypothetical protein EKK37_13185 [Sphingobacteriales bacterium]|nr:MAG: hypothetical protein EKK37_13185 [Sphingobacteriales bacterium]
MNKAIAVFDTDSLLSIKLTQKAVEKFDSAYHCDTTNSRSTFFAAECTMGSQDFKGCIYWISKYMEFDTSNDEKIDGYLKLGLCYSNLGEPEAAKYYYNKLISKDSNITNTISVNLLKYANNIYYHTNPNQQKLLLEKGVNACNYSVELLKYINSIDKSQKLDSLISLRIKNCK